MSINVGHKSFFHQKILFKKLSNFIFFKYERNLWMTKRKKLWFYFRNLNRFYLVFLPEKFFFRWRILILINDKSQNRGFHKKKKKLSQVDFRELITSKKTFLLRALSLWIKIPLKKFHPAIIFYDNWISKLNNISYLLIPPPCSNLGSETAKYQIEGQK